MTKKGKLTLVEKAAIQTFISQGKDVAEIASTLDRTKNIVTKYINSELDDLHSTIVNAQMEAAEAEQEHERYSKARKDDLFNIREAKTQDLKDVTDSATVNAVQRRLSQAGLRDNDIAKVLKLAIDRYASAGRQFKNEDELYTECIRQMKAGEFMIKKSQGGRDGVAIMTPAASQRSDDNKSASPSRSVRDNVFRPNG